MGVVGGLVNYRMGEPLAEPEAMQADAATLDPRSLLKTGAATSASVASRFLVNDDRADATHAMDAAIRVAEVGAHVLEGDAGRQFQQALQRIKQGRRALQMGRSAAAPELFREAASLLAAIEKQKGSLKAPTRNWNAYEGAVVMNALGIRIGEVDAVGTSANGERSVAVVLGGAQDFLGFLDFGGVDVRVVADQVIFGKTKTIGSTYVVLPTLESSIDRLQLLARERGWLPEQG